MGYATGATPPTTGAHAASAVSLLDAAGQYVATDVEAALAEASTGRSPEPAWNGFLAWSEDPEFASTNRQPAAATIYLKKILVPRTILVTNISVACSVVGTVYTNAQLGLYSSAGTYLSASAVQASAGTNGFGATGTVTLALAAAQTITGGPTVFVWAAVHAGTNSATAFALIGPTAGTVANNIGLAAATLRCATQTGHATNPLATIGNLTPASNSTTNSNTANIFFGLS